MKTLNFPFPGTPSGDTLLKKVLGMTLDMSKGFQTMFLDLKLKRVSLMASARISNQTLERLFPRSGLEKNA